MKVLESLKHDKIQDKAISHATVECYLGYDFQYLGSIFLIYTISGSVVGKPCKMVFLALLFENSSVFKAQLFFNCNL